MRLTVSLKKNLIIKIPKKLICKIINTSQKISSLNKDNYFKALKCRKSKCFGGEALITFNKFIYNRTFVFNCCSFSN